MFNKVETYPVCGSSALKPDCSRYSNENERIIVFDGSTENSAHVEARLSDMLKGFQLSKDLLNGSIQGHAISNVGVAKIGIAGIVYVALAVTALVLCALL